MRIIRTVNFRILYEDLQGRGWLQLAKYLFVVFSTQMQWMTLKPDQIDASKMVASILLLQTVVYSQSEFLGRENIATHVIYITYAIAIVLNIAIALMTFINLSRESGKREWLCKHQQEIYYNLRVLGLLLTPLFIPAIYHKTDKETGQQSFVPWLWGLTAGICSALYVALVFWNSYAVFLQNKKLVSEEKEGAYTAVAPDTNTPVSEWKVADVKNWIANGTDMESQSNFTSDELHTIAAKFEANMVNGEVFVRISEDPSELVKYVELNIGQALHFSSVVTELKNRGFLSFYAHAPRPLEEAPFDESKINKESLNAYL